MMQIQIGCHHSLNQILNLTSFHREAFLLLQCSACSKIRVVCGSTLILIDSVFNVGAAYYDLVLLKPMFRDLGKLLVIVVVNHHCMDLLLS